MGLRRIIAALGLLSGVVAAPAPATAAPPWELVLSGTRTGYVDITLPRAASVVPMHLRGFRDRNEGTIADGWSWRGCGGVRGFYLRPRSGDPLNGVGAVDFAALRFGAPTSLPVPGGDVPRIATPLGKRHMGILAPADLATHLPAGRYRAYLIGEGTCEVRVQLASSAGRAIRGTVRSATPLHYSVTESQAPPPQTVPVPRTVSAVVPVKVTRATLAFAMIHRIVMEAATGRVAPSSDTSWAACVEANSRPGCWDTLPTADGEITSGMYFNTSRAYPPYVDGGVAGRTYLPYGAGVDQISTWYAPGWLPAGALNAKAYATSTPTTALQAVTFTLDL